MEKYKADPVPQNHHPLLFWIQDIDGLEVIGSGKPFTNVAVCHSPALEKEEEEKEHVEKWEMSAYLIFI